MSVYNLRNEKKNNKNIKMTKSMGAINTENMRTCNNSELTTPSVCGISDTPTTRRLKDVHLHTTTSSSRLSSHSCLDSPFKLINCLDNRFGKLTEQIMQMIDTKFQEFRDDLFRDLSVKYKALEDKLHSMNERVTKLEQTSFELTAMKDEIKILKSRLIQQENYPVASELRLNEIPYSENENLVSIFQSICNIINIPSPNLRSIYRQNNYNSKNRPHSNDAVIIVKFWSVYDKNKFVKSLANFRKLNKSFTFRLRDIGFDSNEKFYLNENLTQSNFKILKASLRLKKSRLIYTAFTMRGSVYIKQKINDDPVLIDEIGCLQQLFPDLGDQAARSGN